MYIYPQLQLFQIAGAQYVGVHLANAGVYTGNALLLRQNLLSDLSMNPELILDFFVVGQVKMSLRRLNVQLQSLCKLPLEILVPLQGKSLLYLFVTCPKPTLFITSVLIYRPDLSGHRFRKPHIISIGYLLFSVLVTIYLSTWMNRENKRRDRLLSEGEKIQPSSTPEERQRLGDRDLHYRYVT